MMVGRLLVLLTMVTWFLFTLIVPNLDKLEKIIQHNMQMFCATRNV